MFIDTHCHLADIDYKKDGTSFSEVLQISQDYDVTQILAVSTNFENFLKLKELTLGTDVYLACGIYPLEIDIENQDVVSKLTKLADDPRVIALGETGLEYTYKERSISVQRENFIQHIEVAHALNKPILVHSRGAREDTLSLLKEGNIEQVGGILHCFTEDYEMAYKLIDMNMYISISGIVTFKNAATLREVVRQLPLDHLLCETDSPYLAPVPYRGKQNKPFYVTEVYKYIAELKSIPLETLETALSNNFAKLFHL